MRGEEIRECQRKQCHPRVTLEMRRREPEVMLDSEKYKCLGLRMETFTASEKREVASVCGVGEGRRQASRV